MGSVRQMRHVVSYWMPGLTSVEELSLSHTTVYSCISCLNLDIVDVFDTKIAHLLSEEDELTHKCIEARIKCDNYKADYNNLQGEWENQLNNALEGIKVVRQAYHGNVMVGNHSIIVLKKYHELTAVISNKVEIRNKFDEIFEIFSRAMRLITARRFLTEDEISVLEILTTQFGENFPLYFPNRNITRKIHEFIYNIVQFAKKQNDRYAQRGRIREQACSDKCCLTICRMCT